MNVCPILNQTHLTEIYVPFSIHIESTRFIKTVQRLMQIANQAEPKIRSEIYLVEI